MRMKLTLLAVAALSLAATGTAAERARVVPQVDPLPKALDGDFEFRKTKLFLLSDNKTGSIQVGGLRPGKAKAVGSNESEGADASINFERQYRLFGAVTNYDRRQRYGNYFDFFWRAKRDADLTVRLEYRQDKLRSFVQAREVRYPNARGSHKTEFRIIGDDFLDDGRVIAWRALLVENGRIVAENRSYLWE